MIKTGGATFDPREKNVYFLATNVEQIQRSAIPVHNYVLIAVNELSTSNDDLPRLEGWLSQKKKVFIDSGIFNLTNEHKRKHGISMDEALGLAPEDIDGFDELFEKYVQINRQYGEQSWGYIELDQGGRENKIRTRARLEALGLRPIPVYHPLNDGWDYFDYLAERYDRLCFANVVQADRASRKRLIATAWERHRKYPHLWIHLLGYTPNETLYSMPINSGDSSTWVSVVRWAGHRPRVMGKPFAGMDASYNSVLVKTADRIGMEHEERDELYFKALRSSAYASRMIMENWRVYIGALQREGFDIYPPLTAPEEERYQSKKDGFYEQVSSAGVSPRIG